MDILLFKVAFKPGKSLKPISNEWGNIEFEGGSSQRPCQIRHLDGASRSWDLKGASKNSGID
jgi:hypothetical protein